MLDALQRLRGRVLMAVSRWRSSRAFAKAMRQREPAAGEWFIVVFLVLQSVTAAQGCAHRLQLRTIERIEVTCAEELRRVARTTPLEGMADRLDAVQARCDDALEEARR
jgi:hypothetical protein